MQDTWKERMCCGYDTKRSRSTTETKQNKQQKHEKTTAKQQQQTYEKQTKQKYIINSFQFQLKFPIA